MSRFGSYSSDLWRQKQILMEQDTLFRPRQERIRQLLTQLAAGIYERDYVLAMAFLSAIAGGKHLPVRAARSRQKSHRQTDEAGFSKCAVF